MSEKNPPESVSPDIGKIADAAKAVGVRAKNTTQAKRLAAVEEQLASMEPLLEQLQAHAVLNKALTDYVGDLRSEQVFFNAARYVVGITSLAAVIGLGALLALAIFHPLSPLLTAPPIAIATFIIGLVSSVAIMFNSFVKGVFRSTAERHAEGFLPPALQSSLEVFNKITGRQ